MHETEVALPPTVAAVRAEPAACGVGAQSVLAATVTLRVMNGTPWDLSWRPENDLASADTGCVDAIPLLLLTAPVWVGTPALHRSWSCDVHRELGPGFQESVYEAALVVELRHGGIPFVRQLAIPIVYRGVEDTACY